MALVPLGAPAPVDLPPLPVSDPGATALEEAAPLGLGEPDGWWMPDPSGPSACWTSEPGDFQPDWWFTSLDDCRVEMPVAAAFAGYEPAVPWGSGGFSVPPGGGLEVVPLPGAAWLLLTGVAALAIWARRG